MFKISIVKKEDLEPKSINVDKVVLASSVLREVFRRC